MNIKDSYLHGADGKGVVKWLYLASSAETVYKPSDGTTYTTASGKDLIFQLADISGTKFGITLPQAPAYSRGVQTKSRSTNASHYLVFVDSDNSSATNELLYTDAEIVYNPSTNLLSVPNLIVSGAGGFNYSGIAAATENAATCIWFSDSTNAGIPVTSDNFKYNPSTDTLTVGNIAGQYITIGNTQVALKGTYTPDTSITSSSTHNTIPSSKAVWDLITNIDAFVYKGTLNGGSSTTYTPAANCGYVYKVATAGLINGIYCEVGDLFICNTDSTAAATSSNVGTISTKWDIIQANATMADYLLRAGGTMLGQLKWNDTNALPEDATPSYLVTVSGIPASGNAAITKYTSVTKFKQNVVSNFVIGTQTAATNLWTGALPSGVTAYYDGLSIDYYLPYAGTGTAATLQLGNLGAVQVYNGRGPGNTTTHIPANSIVRMTYYNGKWYINSYYNSDTINTTGGDDTSSKIFIVGMTSQTTSNGSQRTYTHDTCYIGTDGCLYSGGAKVLTALPSSAVTGSGTNGYITRWTGKHTIGNLVALSAAVSSQTQSTKFLREDGTWAAPSYTTNTNTWRNVRINAETSDKLGTGIDTGPLIIKSGTGITVSWDSTNKAVVITNSAPDVNHNTDRTGLKKGTAGSTTASGLVIANSATGLIMEGGTHKFKVGDGTNSFEIPITVTNLSQSSITSLSTFTHTSDLIYAAAGGGNSVADKPTNIDAFGVISFKTAAGYYGQILMEAGGTMYRRSGQTLSGGWKKIADSSNVVNDNISVTWNTETTIATIAGVPIKIKIPANPNSNTWRNIYVAGTQKMTTATSSKALNFKAGSNVTLSYLAPGTTGGTTDSGSADYGTLTITANIPSNNVTGSGTNGYITKWTGTNTIGNLVAIGSGTTKFLREDGTWATPAYIANTDRTGIKLGTVSGTAKTDATVIIAGSTTGLTIQGGTNSFKIGDGTNYINVSVGHGLSTKNMTINGTAYALYTSASSLPTFIAPTSLGSANQILATNSSANGLTWINKPTSNVTTTAVVGSSATATSQITAAQANPYYNLLEGGAVTRSIHFVAGTGITVASDTSGNITITNSSTNTDVNVKVNNTNPTSGTWYYPTWYTATSGTGQLNANDGFRYYALQGTTDALGHSILQIGNDTGSGTAGNKRGRIRLYSENTGYADIYYANTTANTNQTFPAVGGTILNTGTTSFTQVLASGTKIGTIKINGTSTDIFAPTDTNNKVTQNSDTADASYRILLKYSANNTNETNTVKYSGDIVYNPSSKLLTNNGSGIFGGNIETRSTSSFISNSVASPWPSIIFSTRAGTSSIGTGTTTYTTVATNNWANIYCQVPALMKVYATAGDTSSTVTSSSYYNTRFFFREYSHNNGTKVNYYEDYSLPEATVNRSSNASYYILTTKNTSASGGGSTWGSSLTVTMNGTAYTLTIPSNPNTDYRVRQASTTTDKWRSVLLGYIGYDAWNTAVGDTVDNQSYITNSIRFQPSTGTLSSTKLGINGQNNSHNLYVNGSSLLAGTLTTYTSGTGSYDQGIRINRTATNQWATLLIGKSGTSTSGTGTSTAGDGAWLIGTPPSKNSLVVCLNGSSESSCLCLAGSGNNDMKWNGNIVAHAGNVTLPSPIATIGTSDTTIVTIAGVAVKAKIGSYASSSHNHGTSKTAWGQIYVNASGALQTIKGTITSDYFIIQDSSTNPYLKLVHTYSSTSYTYYVQGYQGKLQLGNTSAKSVQIDSTGRTTINYDGSAAELLTLTGGSSCTNSCIKYSALTSGYSWSVGINKDHYYVWNSNLNGKPIAVDNNGSFEINSSLTGGIAHIKFTRASYNYIQVPTDGTLAVCVNTVSSAGAKLAVNTSSVFPGTTNAVTLGTTSLRWSNIYAQSTIMVGNTSYTTSTSNVSGTTIVPGCIIVCATATGVAYTLYDKKVLVGSLQIAALGTATVDNGNSTYTSAIGECRLVLGNNKIGKTNATGSVLGNAMGSIQIFGSNSTYTRILSNPNGSRDVYLPYYAGTMYLVHTGSATATVGGSTTPVYVAANGRITAGSAYYSQTQADGGFHPLNGKITRAGGSYSWYNIQQYNSSDAHPSYYTADCAIINITSYTGWQPWIRAVDSEKGSWAIGQHTNALYIGRITKANTSNALTYKWTFGATGDLTMTGSCYAAHFYENSDIRLKKIIKGSEYSVYDYAEIPIINFYWLNKIKNQDLHIGSIAQSVEGIIPEVVISDEYKSIDYGVLGTIASITACKKLVEHDIEIYNLKEEIKMLKNKIKEMEEQYG